MGWSSFESMYSGRSANEEMKRNSEIDQRDGEVRTEDDGVRREELGIYIRRL